MDHNLYNLATLPGNYERRVTASRLRGFDWFIKNTFPIELHIYLEKAWTDYVTHLSIIRPHQTINLSPESLHENDKLYVFYEGRPFVEPYTIKNFEKIITIGAVGYSSGPGAREYTASQSDISGIRLINRCSMPLNFYYKGNLVAQVGSYTGQTYLGGGNNSVFFDNTRQGMDMWDALSVSFSKPGKEELNWTTIILEDNQIKEIYLGIVQGQYRGPDPDTYSYRVTDMDWTGQTFYRPVGGYQTVSTNPFAPF